MADMVPESSFRKLIAWWEETRYPKPFTSAEVAVENLFPEYSQQQRYVANILLVLKRHGWAQRVGTFSVGAAVRSPIYVLSLPEDKELNPPWQRNKTEGWRASGLCIEKDPDAPPVFDFSALEETGWLQTRPPLKCPKPSYRRKMVYHKEADTVFKPVYSMHIFDRGESYVEHVYDEVMLMAAAMAKFGGRGNHGSR
jgi:hypothetical protein